MTAQTPSNSRAPSHVLAPSNDRILRGVVMMIAFCLIAPLIDIASKLAVQTVPVSAVTMARFLVQGVLMAPVMLVLRVSLRLSARAMHILFWRALVSIMSTWCFVAAVQVMPVADALAIAFVEPFIILLIGKLVMEEQVGPRRLGAAIVGFGGSLLVIQPSFAHFGWVALFPLGTALAFALYILITRHLSHQMAPEPMQFHTAWIAALILVPVLWLADGSGIAGLDPAWPTGIAWLWTFGVGLAATVSHMFISYGLRYAPSSTLAPLHYLEIVMAVTLGYLVFGTFPNLMTWAGIAIITASGLYVIHRERLAHRSLASRLQ